MTRYALLAVVPALALCAPAFAQQMQSADMTSPPPLPGPPTASAAAVMTQAPPITVHTDPATGAVVETITLPPGTRPPPAGEADGAIALTATPHFTWVGGHYNWDPGQDKYVWIVGQYMQAPRDQAHWVAGRWQRAPDNSLAWIDGHFQ